MSATSIGGERQHFGLESALELQDHSRELLELLGHIALETAREQDPQLYKSKMATVQQLTNAVSNLIVAADLMAAGETRQIDIDIAPASEGQTSPVAEIDLTESDILDEEVVSTGSDENAGAGDVGDIADAPVEDGLPLPEDEPERTIVQTPAVDEKGMEEQSVQPRTTGREDAKEDKPSVTYEVSGHDGRTFKITRQAESIFINGRKIPLTGGGLELLDVFIVYAGTELDRSDFDRLVRFHANRPSKSAMNQAFAYAMNSLGVALKDTELLRRIGPVHKPKYLFGTSSKLLTDETLALPKSEEPDITTSGPEEDDQPSDAETGSGTALSTGAEKHEAFSVPATKTDVSTQLSERPSIKMTKEGIMLNGNKYPLTNEERQIIIELKLSSRPLTTKEIAENISGMTDVSQESYDQIELSLFKLACSGLATVHRAPGVKAGFTSTYELNNDPPSPDEAILLDIDGEEILVNGQALKIVKVLQASPNLIKAVEVIRRAYGGERVSDEIFDEVCVLMKGPLFEMGVLEKNNEFFSLSRRVREELQAALGIPKQQSNTREVHLRHEKKSEEKSPKLPASTLYANCLVVGDDEIVEFNAGEQRVVDLFRDRLGIPVHENDMVAELFGERTGATVGAFRGATGRLFDLLIEHGHLVRTKKGDAIFYEARSSIAGKF